MFLFLVVQGPLSLRWGVDAPFSLFFTFTDAFTQFMHRIGFMNAFTFIQYRIEPTRASTMARCGVANTPAALPPDRLFSHRTNRRPPPVFLANEHVCLKTDAHVSALKRLNTPKATGELFLTNSRTGARFGICVRRENT